MTDTALWTQIVMFKVIETEPTPFPWKDYSTLMVVTASGPDDLWAWPEGYNPVGPLLVVEPSFLLILSTITLAGAIIPTNLISLGRGWSTIRDTVMHEISHTLGLENLYTPPRGALNVGNWDIMDSSIDLPYLTAAHRLRLEWLPSDNVAHFNFYDGKPIDTYVTLAPAEIAYEGVGYLAAIEIRVAPKWNYYIE